MSEIEQLYTVKTPNPSFNGSRNKVRFIDGEGKATHEQAQQLVNIWGYSCPKLEAHEEFDEAFNTIPHRDDLVGAGLTDILAVASHSDLTQLKNISKAKAKAITRHVNEFVEIEDPEDEEPEQVEGAEDQKAEETKEEAAEEKAETESVK